MQILYSFLFWIRLNLPWFVNNRISIRLCQVYEQYNILKKQKMKKIVASTAILLIALMIETYCQTYDEYSFEDYVRQFSKSYNAEEYELRRQIFDQNLAEIREHNKNPNKSYTQTVNIWTDLSQEQKKQTNKYKPKKSGIKSSPAPLRSLLGAVALPQSLNWTSLGKVTPVKNQGDCGSCWAFTTTALFESYNLICNSPSYDLSEEYVLQCSGAGSCDGGVPNDALKAIFPTGIPQQSGYPYTQSDTTASKCSNSKVKYPGEVVSITHYTTLTNDGVKTQLLNGPLAVGVSAGNNAFMNYGSGVFSGCPTGADIDHAVLLVGYTAEGHWIIKNSWGEDWGEFGYITIHKDNDCGLKSYVDVVATKPCAATSNTTTNTTGNTTANTTGNTTSNTTNTTTNTTTNNTTSNTTANTTSNTTSNTTNYTMNFTTDPSYITYTVKLTDTFGDGWNGNVIGIQQSGLIVATFGSNFSIGATYGPIKLSIKNNTYAEVIVTTYASWTSEIGFTIYDDKGKAVYTRTPLTYLSNYIFYSFCPYCSASTTASLYLTLTDSWGDGWSGNVLAIKQGQTYYPFGSNFTNGHQYPYTIRVDGIVMGQTFYLVPYVLGTYKQELGVVCRDVYGNKILELVPGISFSAGSTLGQGCLGCVSPLKAKLLQATPQLHRQDDQKKKLLAADAPEQKTSTTNLVKQGDPQPHLIGGQATAIISILSVLVLVLTMVLIVMVLALYKLWKRVKQYGESQTDINMTRSHVTQSNFPENKQQCLSDFDKSAKSQM